MSNYEFKSNFSEYICGLIKQKRAIGYKYEPQEAILRRFDMFCYTYYPNEHTLTKELVLHWGTRTCTESIRTQRRRITPIRSLGEYISCFAEKEAYIYPMRVLPRHSSYTPHIFSDEEIKNLSEAIDNVKYCANAPIRHLILPIYFRVLYCCGLRLSEVQKLTPEQVDLENGILTILDSKNGKDRLIPMHESLTEMCRIYAKKARIYETNQAYFFPNTCGGEYSSSSLYKFFRAKLWECRISHGGRGSGPRIHDFRHTFAVKCLKSWVISKKDLNACLPYLKTYLGHCSFNDTAYYLRLTADIYPELLKQIEESCGGIIPVIGGELNA